MICTNCFLLHYYYATTFFKFEEKTVLTHNSPYCVVQLITRRLSFANFANVSHTRYSPKFRPGWQFTSSSIYLQKPDYIFDIRFLWVDVLFTNQYHYYNSLRYFHRRDIFMILTKKIEIFAKYTAYTNMSNVTLWPILFCFIKCMVWQYVDDMVLSIFSKLFRQKWKEITEQILPPQQEVNEFYIGQRTLIEFSYTLGQSIHITQQMVC